MWVSTFFSRLVVPFDFGNRFGHLFLREITFDHIGIPGQNGILAIPDNNRILGIIDERVEIGTDKFQFITDPQHQRGFPPGAENLVRMINGNNRKGKGSFQHIQSFHQCQLNIVALLVMLFQQVRNHFGIRIRVKLMSFADQPVPKKPIVG